MKKEKSKPQKRNKVREIDFIGKMITLLKILQEKTDEETTLMQKELLEEMTKREYACSERVMVDYLRGLASVMNPTNEAGQQDLTKEKEEFKILYRDLEKKLRKVKEGASAEKIMEQETSFQISAIRFQHLFSFKELLYNGKYYLVGALDGYENVSFYRMDLIFDLTTKPRESLIKEVDPLTGEIKRVKALRRKAVKIKGLPCKWDSKTASKFQAQHLYMYYGDVEEITLKVDRERYTLIHDYWGENYTFIKHIDEKYDEVVLECVPEAMEVWALQCSDCVEVLAPQNLRNRIKEKCEKLAAKYEKTL